jgi:hypothetical protein
MTSWRRHLERHWLAAAAGLLLLFCALADYQFARTTHFNSDSVQNFNELAAINAGNYRLHQWSLATDNFYFTDLPFYVAGRWIFGYRPALLVIVPYAVFMLFLLACILIVRHAGKTAAQRNLGSIAVMILLGLPFAWDQSQLLQSAIHGATLALAAWVFYLGQRIIERPRGWFLLLPPFGVIVFAVAGSDAQVDGYCLGPLLTLVPLRAWLYGKFRLAEWALFVCVIAAGGLGVYAIDYISRHGGFALAQNYSLDFVATVLDVWHNTKAMLVALQMAFDAHPAVAHGHRSIAISRFVTGLAVAALCLRVIWRAPRAPQCALAQWLVLGAIGLAAADVMSGIFATIVADSAPGLPKFAVRYVMPMYICMSLAAVIEAQDFFATFRARWLRIPAAAVAVLLAVIFLAGAAQAALRASLQPSFAASTPQYHLALWLRAHDLRYGVGDYWTTQTLTALGYGAVIADPVCAVDGRLVPIHWVNDLSRSEANWHPQFVVFSPKNVWAINLAAVTATYGKPAAVWTLYGETVAVLK